MNAKIDNRLFGLFSDFKKIGRSIPFSEKLNGAENAIIMHMYFYSLSTDSNQTVTVSKINEKMPMSRAALSQHFNSLEEKGYIVRKIQSEDRRSIELEITEKGRDVQHENLKLTDDFFDMVSDKFGKEKFVAMLSLISEFANLTDELNKLKEDEKLD